MERFSADYIRQQPEYRYLVHRDTGHVIQTCVEDGEVKLRFGHHPGPPGNNTVRLPERPSRQVSVNSGVSGSVSHSVVFHLTTKEPDHLAVAPQSTNVRKKDFRLQRRAGGVAGQSENNASADIHQQGLIKGTAELSTDTQRRDSHGQKITTRTRASRDAGNKDIGQENTGDIARHFTDPANIEPHGQGQAVRLPRDARNSDVYGHEDIESEGNAGMSTSTNNRDAQEHRETGGTAAQSMHREQKEVGGRRNFDSRTSEHSTETEKCDDFHGRKEVARLSAGNFNHTFERTGFGVHRHADSSVAHAPVYDVSVTEPHADTRNDLDNVNDMCETDDETTQRAAAREDDGETCAERSEVQGVKKTNTTTAQRKPLGVSRSASKETASKGKASSCSKKVTDKTQTHRRSRKTLITASLRNSSYDPRQQTRKITRGKEDGDNVRQIGSAESEAETKNACHAASDVSTPCKMKTATPNNGDTRNEPDEGHFLNVFENKNGNDSELSRADKHVTDYKLPTQLTSQTGLDRFMNDNELKTQPSGTARQFLGSFRGLTISEEADKDDRITEQAALDEDDRINEQAALPVDTICSTANAHVSRSQGHTTQIDRPERDQLLTGSSACVGAEDQWVDAESYSGYPKPVTRVDVIETHTPRNTTGVHTAHGQLSEPEDTVSQNKGAEDTVTPASVIIPVIIVDDVSTEADGSEYSEDADAVSIDADEYLALIQCVQSDAKNGDFSSNARGSQDSQNVLSRLTSRVLWEHYSNNKSSLDVPNYPKLSQERMPSRWEDKFPGPQTGSDFTRRYSTPAALEAAGLRRKLTPATYNVEFQSYTALKPQTPRDSSSLPNVRRDSLLPPSEAGSRRGSLKSAMSSRRSSVSGAGPVRWDLGLSDTSSLSRQVSWAGNVPSTRNLSRRRHSSAQGMYSGKPAGTAHDPHGWRSREIHQLDEEQLTEPGQCPRKQSETKSSDLQAIRRMSTVSATSTGRSRRASRVDSMTGEEVDALDLLMRQASQVKRASLLLLLLSAASHIPFR